MKLKIIVVIIGFLLIAPIVPFTSAHEDQATVEVFDSFGKKISETKIKECELSTLDKDIKNGDLSALGINFDFGVSNYMISYGRGNVYVPLKTDRSFLRMILRPIFFNYYEGGFTLVKLGANYGWKGPTIGDYGFLIMDQFGMMINFFGLHIKISWKLRAETHIFIGGGLMVAGYDRLL